MMNSSMTKTLMMNQDVDDVDDVADVEDESKNI